MLTEGPGLSEGYARVMAEAASVCLDSQGHQSPAALEVVERSRSEMVSLLFRAVTDDLRRNHNDENRATEMGACGVAILICRHRLGHGVVAQAYQQEGIDYWIGDVEEGRPLNRKMRLEVSGIRCGDSADIKRRFSQKRKTTAKSDGAYPVVVMVVEFGRPQAHVEARE